MTTLSLTRFIENALTIAVRSVIQGHHSGVRLRFINDGANQPIWLEFDALPSPGTGTAPYQKEHWLRTNDPDSLFGQNRSFSQQGSDALKLIEPAKQFMLLKTGDASSIQVNFKFQWADGSPESEVEARWPQGLTR